MFAAVTAKAREPHWYVAGEVPDMIDGRFRVLATLCALVAIRLEAFSTAGEAESVALTERFIEVMETEHREIGLGDPTLGKKVRKLVGALARRVALWRNTVTGSADWKEAVLGSVYAEAPSAGGLEHSSSALRAFWNEMNDRSLEEIAGGAI